MTDAISTSAPNSEPASVPTSGTDAVLVQKSLRTLAQIDIEADRLHKINTALGYVIDQLLKEVDDDDEQAVGALQALSIIHGELGQRIRFVAELSYLSHNQLQKQEVAS